MTPAPTPPATPRYSAGFGNQPVTEAVPGALPQGRNSPQRAPYGLYAEQISGTSFTTPREANRRSWVYRLQPSAKHPRYSRTDNRLLRTAPLGDVPANPNRLRWSSFPLPTEPTDFIEGLTTLAANGDALSHTGIGIHVYAASASMTDRYFVNADGEFLVVPQQGGLRVRTELGVLELAPGEIAVLPPGIRYAVDLAVNLVGDVASGYVLENYGRFFVLPELGAIGANGLANPRDFLAPVAAFEDRDEPVEVVQKFGGNLWSSRYDHSPLDVVAWHGNYTPYKYDLARFMVIGSISFDHPDPSIFTVLTSPSLTPGVANADFVIFPPRWLVGENTFRPPWFHRNIMSEFMGLIHGVYDAKAEGFLPGGASLHNTWTSHGPDAVTYARASAGPQPPEKVDDTLAFMFETGLPLLLSEAAVSAPGLQADYDDVWSTLTKDASFD